MLGTHVIFVGMQGFDLDGTIFELGLDNGCNYDAAWSLFDGNDGADGFNTSCPSQKVLLPPHKRLVPALAAIVKPQGR